MATASAGEEFTRKRTDCPVSRKVEKFHVYIGVKNMKKVFVLGCGDVGFAVAKELKRFGKELTIIDRDKAKVEMLRELDYPAFEGDFGSPQALEDAGIGQAKAVFIAAPDLSNVKRALKALDQVKIKLGIDPPILARISDAAEAWEIKRLGASEVLPSTQILANFAFHRFERLERMKKEKRLRALLRELSGRMAIVLRNDPDPDGIASGEALKLYAKAFGVDADLIYGGSLKHPQSRAMVNLLDLDLLHTDSVDFTGYAGFALVGVATHVRCALPKEILPTIVIDHHPVPLGEVGARFHDITLVGATSTLLANYLECAAIRIDEATATALVVGILTSTQGFTVGATPLDLETFERLMPLANSELLRRLWSLRQGDIPSGET